VRLDIIKHRLGQVGLVASLAFIAGILALPVKAAEPNWTGFYIGANGGYMVQTSRAVDEQGIQTFDVSTATDAFTYGVQGGFDARLGKSNIVIGILASIDWTNADKHLSIGSTTVGDTEIDHVWAAGGRAGLLLSPSVLLYASGGYAQAKMKTDLGSGTDDKAKGYFVGAGVEAMLASGWSTRLDYRFVDLGNDTIKWATQSTAVADVDKNMHQIRLGISYKFDPPKEVSAAAASLDVPAPEVSKPAASTKAKKIAP
jgi:outer membrane immunogenic protein